MKIQGENENKSSKEREGSRKKERKRVEGDKERGGKGLVYRQI